MKGQQMVSESTYRKMSLEELIQARDIIIGLIGEKQAAAREQFKAEVLEKARLLGIDPVSLFGSTRAVRGPSKRGDVTAKYRDPADPSNTWSGRGRMATWLQHYVAAGRSKDEFLVK